MKYIITFLLFILVSCQNQNSQYLVSAIEFYNRASKDWIYANKISDFDFKGKIDRPVGTDLFLFQINFLDIGTKRLQSQCVYYKVPFKKIQGELIITENRELFKCSETPSAQLLFKTVGVTDLEIFYQQFVLMMKFKIGNKLHDFRIPLSNIKGPSLHKKYQVETELRYRNGMSYVRIDRESKFLPNTVYHGKKEDRFSKNTAIQCFKIDKTCVQVGEDFCDSCRYGSFEVVDYNCPQGGSRFCGKNHCGEKNEPACLRGIKTLDSEEDGICNDDLNPVLNADHILICQ